MKIYLERNLDMAIGTPFHERTAALNHSLNWREWGGYFAAGRYNEFHQPEYAAIRNGAAVIDVSPLHKYRIHGRHAERLLNRVVTRNVSRQKVGQVIYTPWCDAEGKILQEGTVMRLAEDDFQLNATESCLRWLRFAGAGFDVQVEDVSEEMAALAVQGPESRTLLNLVTDGAVESLAFFYSCSAHIAEVPVIITRTGYTGDLGYEIWMPAAEAVRVWDILMDVGAGHGVTPCGILALDIARIEAGFVMLGVDYLNAETACIPSQKSTPAELGMDWAVKLKKKVPCIGRDALAAERRQGKPQWKLVGLEVPWEPLEELYTSAGLMPDLPTVAWREAVPVYAGARQIGRATSGCWSTLLKKYIALATVEAQHAGPGTGVEMEVTVDYCRRVAPARVVELPFFRPERLRAAF